MKTQGNLNWSWWRKQGFNWLQKELESVLAGSTVLDIGAGEGKYKTLFSNFNHVTMDFTKYEGIDLVLDITKQIPPSADVIVLANMLEHIKEPEAALKNCWLSLKPKGKILITVPFTIKLHQMPNDYLRYTHFMLLYILEKVGFIDIKIQQVGGIVEVKDSVVTNYIGTLYHNSSSWRVKIGSRLLKLFFYILDPVIKTQIPHNYWVLGYHISAVKNG